MAKYTFLAAVKEAAALTVDTVKGIAIGEPLMLRSRVRCYWEVVSGQVDVDEPLPLTLTAKKTGKRRGHWSRRWRMPRVD